MGGGGGGGVPIRLLRSTMRANSTISISSAMWPLDFVTKKSKNSKDNFLFREKCLAVYISV